MTGKLVYSGSWVNTLDVSTLADGMYFLRTIGSDKSEDFKFEGQLKRLNKQIKKQGSPCFFILAQRISSYEAFLSTHLGSDLPAG